MKKGVAIVVSCEHASNDVKEYSHLFKENEGVLETHLGYDICSEKIARDISKALNAPLLLGTKSRLIIELNRSLEHPSLFSDYSSKLSEKEKEKLIQQYYMPYRDKLSDLIKDGISSHGHVLHLSIHSFTPVLNGNVRTADIGILFDPAHKYEGQFCSTWLRSLQENKPDFTSLPNYPYLGSSDGLTTYFRGQFSKTDYMGIEVEVNQLHCDKHEMLTKLLVSSLNEALQRHDLVK